MKSLQSFLESAFNSSAYELILCSGTSPRLRIGRELHVLESQALKASELRALLFEVLDGELRDQLLKEKVLNTSLHLQNRWVTLHASLHLGGFDVCLSWIPDLVQAYWPNHLANLVVKPSSLSFLQSAQASASRCVLRYLLDEVLKERPIRGLGFLRNEIGF
ncbi:MAG: hypothetical protein WCH11_05945, partial [Bdellovibrio sp.]